MIDIVPRSRWQTSTQPVRGPILQRSQIDQVRIHWPGRSSLTSSAPAPHLRSEQAWYLRDRRYSYGYNFYIPRDASVWEIRGFTIQSAATAGVNYRSVAIQFECTESHPPTAAQVETGRWLIKRCDAEFGRELDVLTVYPHNGFGATTATTCPGPDLTRLLPVLRDRPKVEPAPPAVQRRLTMFPELFRFTNHNDVYIRRHGNKFKTRLGPKAIEMEQHAIAKQVRLMGGTEADELRFIEIQERHPGMAPFTGIVANRPGPAWRTKHDKYGRRRS